MTKQTTIVVTGTLRVKGFHLYVIHVGRYRSRVLLSLIPIPGYDLEVKVTDLKISYKSKKNCI